MIASCLTGCQGSGVGKTLPNPNYTDDGIQYFAPGPETKLSREAAAMKAYRADQDLRDEAAMTGENEPSKAVASLEG
jgi:hypothetical protein